MRPVRILYVHGSADLYGSDRSLLNLIRNLDRERFDPILVVPEDGPLVAALRRLDVDVQVRALSVLHRTVSIPYWLHFFAGLPRSVRALCQLIEEQGVQLVHSNSSHVYDGALAARAAAVPHVWHVRELHTALSAIGYPLSRLICAYSDAVIAISAAVSEAFFGRRSCDSKVSIVYNGVDIVEFNPQIDGSAVRAELGLGRTVPVAGVVGRVARWKGHRSFLEAVAQVRASLPEARFLVVGDAVTAGDHRFKEELFELVRREGLGEAVIFTGLRSDVPAIMAALDVLVLPSELPEPFGRVVLEAMATARPVVATRQGGPLEIVVDGESGYLVSPGDSGQMAEAMLSLLQAPERARKMGARGRSHCERQFAQERTHAEIMHLYQQLLDGRNGWKD